jgi:hypothetical protein
VKGPLFTFLIMRSRALASFATVLCLLVIAQCYIMHFGGSEDFIEKSTIFVDPHKAAGFSILEDGRVCISFRNGTLYLPSIDLCGIQEVKLRIGLLDNILNDDQHTNQSRIVLSKANCILVPDRQILLVKYIVNGYPFKQASKLRAWNLYTGEMIYDSPLDTTNLLATDYMSLDCDTERVFYLDFFESYSLVVLDINDPESKNWTISKIPLPFSGLVTSLIASRNPSKPSASSPNRIVVAGTEGIVFLLDTKTLESRSMNLFQSLNAYTSMQSSYDLRNLAISQDRFFVPSLEEPFLYITPDWIESTFNSSSVSITPLSDDAKVHKVPVTPSVYGLSLVYPNDTNNIHPVIYTMTRKLDYDSFDSEIHLYRFTEPNSEWLNLATLSIPDPSLLSWSLQSNPYKEKFGCIYILFSLGQLSIFCPKVPV